MNNESASVASSKKSGMFKKIIIVCAVSLVLIGVAAVLFLDAAAARVVAIAGTRVLGVQTTLSSAHIAILGGTSSLNELAVAQPEGFGTDSMFKVRYAGVTANLPELLSSDVVIEEINIDGVLVTLVEKGSKVNLQVVADSLNQTSDASPAPTATPAPTKDSSGTVTIKQLKVTGIKVLVEGDSHVTAGKILEVNIPDIIVADLGSKTPVSQVAAHVTAQLMNRILLAIVKAQIAGLPSAMASGLQSAAGKVGSIFNGTAEFPMVKGAGTAIKDGVQDLGKGIKNIFGGSSDSAGSADAAPQPPK